MANDMERTVRHALEFCDIFQRLTLKTMFVAALEFTYIKFYV